MMSKQILDLKKHFNIFKLKKTNLSTHINFILKEKIPIYKDIETILFHFHQKTLFSSLFF